MNLVLTDIPAVLTDSSFNWSTVDSHDGNGANYFQPWLQGLFLPRCYLVAAKIR